MLRRRSLLWILLCVGSNLVGLVVASYRLGEEEVDETAAGAAAATVAAEEKHGDEHNENFRILDRTKVDVLFAANHEEEELQVFVGYKSDRGRSRVQSMGFVPSKGDFQEIRAVLMRTTKKKLRELENDEDIEYIEPDYNRSTLSDFVPYGIEYTQGTTKAFPFTPTNAKKARACDSPSSFRVAVVDSGIYAEHLEFGCNAKNGIGCIGKSFGTSAKWNLDFNSHGTHCAGTIAAMGGKTGIGMRGMVQDGLLCLVIVRVFPDSSNEATSSDIMNGVRWAVEQQGAKVVSMSLGADTFSTTEKRFYQMLFNSKGVIVLGAAGNDGSGAMVYPASYKNVVSVAAVDWTLTRADFSQYNKMVDIAAPGVGIISTVAPAGKLQQKYLTTISIQGKSPALLAYPLLYSRIPIDKSGSLVECPKKGKEKCRGSGGHICVIERDISATTFDMQGLNCQKSGGVAAIIYNNGQDGHFGGMLNVSTKVKIPVVSMAGFDYQNTLSKMMGKNATLTTLDGYEPKDGTSTAVPHVSGAVAAIWRACPKCKNVEVVDCLTSTAIDLGPKGRDDQYGHGFIQTEKAYKCLVATCCS